MEIGFLVSKTKENSSHQMTLTLDISTRVLAKKNCSASALANQLKVGKTIKFYFASLPVVLLFLLEK